MPRMDSLFPSALRSGSVHEDRCELLRELFGPLELIEAGTTQRAVDYVLGDLQDAPLEAFKNPRAAEYLRLTEVWEEGARFYELVQTSQLDAGQWLRFAHLCSEAEFYAPRPCRAGPNYRVTNEGTLSHLLRKLEKWERVGGRRFLDLQSLHLLIECWNDGLGIYSEEPWEELIDAGEYLLRLPGAIEYLEQNPEHIVEFLESSWSKKEVPAIAQRFWEHRELFLDLWLAEIRRAFESDSVHERADALKTLSHPIVPIDGFEELLLAWSCDPTDHMQDSAIVLLWRCGEETHKRARELFASPQPEDHWMACRLAYASERQEAMDWLRDQRENIRDADLKDYVDHILYCASFRDRKRDREKLHQLAEVRGLTVQSPLSEAALLSFQAGVRTLRAAIEPGETGCAPWKPSSLQWYREQLEGLQLSGQSLQQYYRIPKGEAGEPWREFFGHAEVNCVHLLRLLLLMGELLGEDEQRRPFEHDLGFLPNTVELFSEVKGGIDARELFAACDVVGVSERSLLRQFLLSTSRDMGMKIEIRNLPQYCEAFPLELLYWVGLDPLAGWTKTGIRCYGLAYGAYPILAQMPIASRFLHSQLLERVFGDSEEESACAKACLSAMTDKAARIAACLNRKTSQIRICSARWLAEEGFTEEIPSLHAALEREKDLKVRLAIREALFDLGDSQDELFCPAGLLKEAKRVLPKKEPARLAWLPVELLTPLHWRECSEPVDPLVIRWLLFRAFKLGRVIPDRVLLRCFEQFEVQEVEHFGSSLCLFWCSRDSLFFSTKGRDPVEVNEELDSLCARKGLDQDKATEAIRGYSELSKTSLGYSKGLLALVVACQSAGAVDLIVRHVRAHEKKRSELREELVEVLGALDHRRSADALSEFARELQPLRLRERAREYLVRLEARNGWTKEA